MMGVPRLAPVVPWPFVKWSITCGLGASHNSSKTRILIYHTIPPFYQLAAMPLPIALTWSAAVTGSIANSVKFLLVS